MGGVVESKNNSRSCRPKMLTFLGRQRRRYFESEGHGWQDDKCQLFSDLRKHTIPMADGSERIRFIFLGRRRADGFLSSFFFPFFFI